MAIFHMTMKVCKSSAAAKIDYIFRKGKYSYSTKAEDLICRESYNLPSWADNAKDFFKEMDKQELSKEEKAARDRQDDSRSLPSNQRNVKCREIEFALPKELSVEENKELADRFIKQIMGDNHAYAWAFHLNKGALSGEENPHVHLVFSDRLIEKDRDVERELFCRQRSGYKKDPLMNGSKRADWYNGVRETWADMVNQALERKGIDDRVSPRRYREQGIDKIPQIHLGHKAIHAAGLGAASPRFEKFKGVIKANHRLEGKQIARQDIEKIKPSWKEIGKAAWNYLVYENSSEEKKELKDTIKGRKMLQKEILGRERIKSSKNTKNAVQAILRNISYSLERKRYFVFLKSLTYEEPLVRERRLQAEEQAKEKAREQAKAEQVRIERLKELARKEEEERINKELAALRKQKEEAERAERERIRKEKWKKLLQEQSKDQGMSR